MKKINKAFYLIIALTLLLPIVRTIAATLPSASLHEKPHLQAATPVYPIKVSSNNRYLVDQNNTPFLYNADTAWAMIWKLNQQQILQYLDDRKNRGIITIQVNLLPWRKTYTNTDGQLPFNNNGDLSQPNESYWQHVDAVIDAAQSRGMLLVLGVAWLGCCDPDEWRDVITSSPNSDSTATSYGLFLGNRYKNKPNIIWLHGGDHDTNNRVTLIAQALSSADPNHLASYHPSLNSSSTSANNYPNASWLTLSMTYTYNPPYSNNYTEYNKSLVKPFILGETRYEGESADAHDVRRNAIWTLLSGGAGSAVGQTDIWQFDSNWSNSLNTAGINNVALFNGIFGSRQWYGLIPDQNNTIVTSGSSSGTDYVTAARTLMGGLIMVYIPSGNGRTITVDMSKLSGAATAKWIDPTNGNESVIAGSPFANTGTRNFTSPNANSANINNENDFILALEVTGTPAPTNTPVPSTFVKGIDFNGPAVTIEGNNWQSYTTALSNGLSVGSVQTTSTNITPNPTTDSNTQSMLNSAIWQSGTNLNLTQSISNGSYNIYIWVMENYQSNFRSFSLNLENVQKASSIGSLTLNSWAKYGPYTVTVIDGVLNIDLIRITGDPHIMGLAIFNTSGIAPTFVPSTNTPTSPSTFVKGVNFNGSAVTIEGNNWQSYSTALANGLTVSAVQTASTSITPNPSTDSATQNMLNTAIYSGVGVNLTQTISNGNYKVYVWMMENWQSNARAINLSVQGTQVANGIGSLGLGNWAKYGPYNASVTNGVLSINLSKASGLEPHIMGLAIFTN